MKRLLLLLISIVLVGCNATLVEEPEVSGMFKNACLPEAIMMSQSLKEHGIDARVLGIYAEDYGHAICVYMYPPGKNQMWGWDSYWKSLRLRAFKDNPESVARAWLRWTNPQKQLTRAEYIQ
jgi:hypothetical protein